MTTTEVQQHHISAFGVGLDEIMKDYSEDSVVISQDSTARGLEEIRAFFQEFLDNFPAEAWESFEMLKVEVVGEVAYQVWKAPPFVNVGTDTFLIRNGKILIQTYAAG